MLALDRATPAARAHRSVPNPAQAVTAKLGRAVSQPDDADRDGVQHSWYSRSPMDLRPTPVITSEICSVCGLDWARHGDKPTAKTCIDLLRADASAARVALANRPFVQPIPYLPYVPPRRNPPYRQYWGGSGGSTWNVISSSDAIPNAPQTLAGVASISSTTASSTI